VQSPLSQNPSPAVLRVEGTQLVFRFDAPEDPAVTPLGGICGDSDSGNPAYLVSRGTVHVVGVGSAQDARPVDRKLGHHGVLELNETAEAPADALAAHVELSDS
jgi:hypothetical protein